MNIQEQNNYKTLNKKYVTHLIFALMISFVFLSNHSFLGISEYAYFPIVLIIVGIFSLYNQNILILKIEHMCILFLLGMTILNLLRYNTSFDFGYFISYLLFFLIFLILTLHNSTTKTVTFLINSYILSTIIISSFINILQKEFNGWEGTGRYTIQFINGSYADPNFISSYIVFGALFCLYKLIALNFNKRYKVILIFLYIYISVAVLLTSSRGALIGLIVGSFIIIFQSGFRKMVLSLFILLAILPIILHFIPEENFLRLFMDSYIDQSNISRFQKWNYGWHAAINHPILGTGLLDSTSIIQRYFNFYGAAHNTFITLTLNYGFFGLFSFVALFFILIKRAIVSRSYFIVGIILSLISMGMLIELSLSLQFWFVLILSYLYLYNLPNTSRKKLAKKAQLQDSMLPRQIKEITN